LIRGWVGDDGGWPQCPAGAARLLLTWIAVMRLIERLLRRSFGKNHRRRTLRIETFAKTLDSIRCFEVGCVRPRVADQRAILRIGLCQECVAIQPD